MTGRKKNTFSLQVGWRREISVCVKIKACKMSISTLSWPGDSMVKWFPTHLSWTNVFLTSLLISTWSRRVHSEGESRDMFCPRTPFLGDLLSRKSLLFLPCLCVLCLPLFKTRISSLLPSSSSPSSSLSLSSSFSPNNFLVLKRKIV